jgi:hypothetical protein
MLARADELLMNASNDDAALVLIAQPQKRWTTILDLAAATAMTLPLLGGVFLLTTEALSKPDAVSLAFAQPVATLQIVVGLLLMAGLLLVPARRLVARAGSGGTLEIDGGIVRVAERGLFSSRSFHEPLDAYRGTALRVRTTISGVHHELVLVHPDARRDVVISLDRVGPSLTPDRMIARIGLPEIAPGEIARHR